MTYEQREIYLLLCMAGRVDEAGEYRRKCEEREEEQSREDG